MTARSLDILRFIRLVRLPLNQSLQLSTFCSPRLCFLTIIPFGCVKPFAVWSVCLVCACGLVVESFWVVCLPNVSLTMNRHKNSPIHQPSPSDTPLHPAAHSFTMGQSSSHPVSLPPSHFLPISPAVVSDGSMKAPPPGCPMHANPAFAPSAPTPVPAPSPPRPAAHPMSGEPPAGCPMHDPSKLKGSSAPVSTITSTSSAPKVAAACPIDHSSMSSTTTSSASSRLVYTPPTDVLADLNPLNQMPELSQSRLSDSQQIELSTDREISTIPRTLTSDEDPTIDPASKRWVYPSAQQFYNALLRKGQEAPEEDIESMVFVHNVLNELAWREVLRWEGRRLGMPEDEYPEVELTKFKGRPGTLSPKAQLYLTLGYLFPDSYNTEPPFDRHDWIIRRPATSTEHRYIIDYYSAPDDPDGSPNFNLDIRPALDDFGSVKDRLSAFLDDWQNGKL